MINKKFMELAIQKAYDGIKDGQTPFGACIVKNNEVISCEHNVVWKTTDITAHAEIHAIRKACKNLNSIDLSSCTIYSTCEPCPMCFSACHWSKIEKIIFGTNISDAKNAGFHELTISNTTMKKEGRSKIEIVENFMREENLKLFKNWKNLNNKTNY
jgi:guanine deaminase